MKQTIKEIGTINIDSINVAEGAIEMRIPVEVISEQLDSKLDEIYECFYKSNPQVNPKDVYYEARLVFQFGRCLNPEFSLMLIVFDKDYKGNDEIWDELEVTISEDVKKQLKKIAWDKLGEAILDL